MKFFSELSKNLIPKNQKPELIHAMNSFGILKYLEVPKMSDKLQCPMCGGEEGLYCFIDPKTSDARMWFCTNGPCLQRYKMQSDKFEEKTPKRALEWKTFCDANRIGNIHFDVSFEKVQQSPAKIEFMRKFVESPQGLLVMRGNPGTGKTYASLAICELFTRKNTFCIFQSQKRIMDDYLQNIQSNNSYNFRETLSTCSLLVIDDFGAIDPSPGFMAYFLDILDERLQWDNRGTVLTTNLDMVKLGKITGEALSDRIKTAQFFNFEGESRRVKKAL